jgi:hypothetical protein
LARLRGLAEENPLAGSLRNGDAVTDCETSDFKRLWNHPATPNRERKRLLAHIIEDAMLIKLPTEEIYSGVKFNKFLAAWEEASWSVLGWEFLDAIDRMLGNRFRNPCADSHEDVFFLR